jgi:hypothetical protein
VSFLFFYSSLSLPKMTVWLTPCSPCLCEDHLFLTESRRTRRELLGVWRRYPNHEARYRIERPRPVARGPVSRRVQAVAGELAAWRCCSPAGFVCQGGVGLPPYREAVKQRSPGSAAQPRHPGLRCETPWAFLILVQALPFFIDFLTRARHLARLTASGRAFCQHGFCLATEKPMFEAEVFVPMVSQ